MPVGEEVQYYPPLSVLKTKDDQYAVVYPVFGPLVSLKVPPCELGLGIFLKFALVGACDKYGGFRALSI